MDTDNKEYQEHIISTLAYMSQKIEDERISRTLCSQCLKMKADIICEACDKPCCLLCINSQLLIVTSGRGIYNPPIASPCIIKRCETCSKKGTCPKLQRIDSNNNQCSIQ